MKCGHGCGKDGGHLGYCDECNTDSCLIPGPNGDGICRHVLPDVEEAELDRLMKIQESKDYEGELAFHRRWG